MKLHTIERIQIINSDINTVWKFFSNPENLNEITPPDMNFEIISKNLPLEIYPGLIIEYKIKPFKGYKIHWITEIKNVIPQKLFIDEQIFGPYKFWHHIHLFEEISLNKTKMIDLVYYRLPFSVIGEIVHLILIRKRLIEIFDYRYKTIEQKFNSK